jgi:hypothetical protein
MGLTVTHAASGQPIWLDVARRTAAAIHAQAAGGGVWGGWTSIALLDGARR